MVPGDKLLLYVSAVLNGIEAGGPEQNMQTLHRSAVELQ